MVTNAINNEHYQHTKSIEFTSVTQKCNSLTNHRTVVEAGTPIHFLFTPSTRFTNT